MDRRRLHQIDPLERQPDTGGIGNGLSPMDPPAAYAPPAMDRVPPEAMHPFLRKLNEGHARLLGELTRFEETIQAIPATGYTKATDETLRRFFHCFDRDFIPQCRREEALLFPRLRERLLAAGEHSTGATPTTAVELMQDDHLKAVQRAAVVLNLLELAVRLPDERSRLIVLDAALEHGKTLIELLRLHIFREDHIVFAQAHRLLSAAAFDAMQSKDAS